MNNLSKALPVLFATMGHAQTPLDYGVQKIDYGFTTSTFSGITLNNFSSEKILKAEKLIQPQGLKNDLLRFNYGWKQGLFLWVNFTHCLAYKPELNVVFCVNRNKNLFSNNEKNIYSTSLGLEFKPQLIIRLGCWNSQPVIKMARNMSYYLTGKQSYLIIGPKFSYQKTDKRFLQNNNSNYLVGVVIGGGVDNLFPNLNFAPELLLSLEYKTGNYNLNSYSVNRYYASLGVAVNFF